MNSIKTVAVILFALVFCLGAADAAETVKPLQASSFHTANKDVIGYFTLDKGVCKVVLMLTDKIIYAPARFEQAVEALKSMSYQVDDGAALEFACQADAQLMTVTLVAKVADKH